MHALSVAAPQGRRTTDALAIPHIASLALTGLTLFGFGLRLYLIDRFPMREDEAIYSFWALHAWREDPLFLTVWPDKPPLFLWLLSATFQLLGASQASAQALNIALSTLTIPVVGVCAQRLWGVRASLVAALSFSLNPFAISFAATAFTDPLLVLAGMLAVATALRGRATWAGCWLAAAIMTKQQGLLYTPLIVSLLYFSSWISDFRLQHPPHFAFYISHSALRTILSFIVGFSIPLFPILYWDSLRWSVAPSPWDLSVRNYGALALAPINQWPLRWHEWSGLAWQLVASWPVWGVLLGGVGLTIAFTKGQEVGGRGQGADAHWALRTPYFAQLLTFWALAFFAVHVATTVQIWDRYLLPLAPVVALLAGWLAGRWINAVSSRWLVVGLLAWMLLLTPPAVTAAVGGLPIGGDHGAYSGLTEAINWLAAEYPHNVALYHHALGWHYRFYLYDQVAAGAYELRWFPSAVYLADNAVKAPHRPKFLIQPDWAPVRDLPLHLAVRGLQLRQRQRAGHFTVFEIVQPLQPFCTWCACAAPQRFPIFTPFVDEGLMSRR